MEQHQLGNCPLCNETYSKDNIRTKHHVFPRLWYNSQVTVFCCERCHKEFHCIYPMNPNNRWSTYKCIRYWRMFCESKYKNPFKVYPILERI